MSVEYELEFVESFSSPLSGVETDETALGPDARQHLQEMLCMSGPSVAEYGGEEPWTHSWRGTFRPDDVPAVRVDDDAGFEEKAEYAVDSLMTFFGSGCTPNNTSVEDFEWTVEVNTNPPSILADGAYSVRIMWVPK